MLYPTHIRTGYLFGFVTAIIFTSTIYVQNANNGYAGLAMSVILTLSGAVFGAEFPDIDSASSIPRRKHPFFACFFKFFNIQHRGRFSHSVLSETLFWGAILGGVYFLLQSLSGLDDSNYYFVMLAFKIFFAAAIGKQLLTIFGAVNSLLHSQISSFSGLANFALFIMTNDNQYAKLAKYRQPNAFEQRILWVLSYGVGAVLVMLLMPVDNTTKATLISNTTYYAGIYLIGVWAGVMSHMLMDVSTREGIYIFWTNRFSPAKQMERIPILKLFVPNNQFRTGSGWETVVRIIVSIIDIILIVLLVAKLINLIKTGQF